MREAAGQRWEQVMTEGPFGCVKYQAARLKLLICMCLQSSNCLHRQRHVVLGNHSSRCGESCCTEPWRVGPDEGAILPYQSANYGGAPPCRTWHGGHNIKRPRCMVLPPLSLGWIDHGIAGGQDAAASQGLKICRQCQLLSLPLTAPACACSAKRFPTMHCCLTTPCTCSCPLPSS